MLKRPLLMYNHPMAISLETQEIIFAFAADNKDNYESWGKYELDELQDAIAEMPEEDRDSTAGQRVKDRIKELESGHDQVQELRQEEEEKLAEQQSEDSKQKDTPEPQPKPQPKPQSEETEAAKPKTPMIMGGIILGIIILLLGLYFFA